MCRGYITTLFAFIFWGTAQGQDSVRVLQEVEIESFRYNRPLKDVPASISVIQAAELARFDNSSFVPVINTIPGVRMEERSPGSYRLSIRGSLIRSPFGIRNVKMYWNSLPLTDAGGNTYLNLLDLSSTGKIEVFKGPGSSLYGAGTGGVVLLSSPVTRQNAFEASTLFGSYGLRRIQFKGDIVKGPVSGSINYAHQESDGYRDHTALRRDAFNTDWHFSLSPKTFLSTTIFYTDVFYETPGGLTWEQFIANPKQARPAAGPNRGAEEQNASVRNKTLYTGISLDHDWNEWWSIRAGFYSSFSDFENYAITNFEQREEGNTGLRIENQGRFGKDGKHKLVAGIEYQRLGSPVKVYANNSGEQGDIRISDDLFTSQFLIFSQAEFTLPYDFLLTAGISETFLKYSFERVYPVLPENKSDFSGVFSPRLAILKKITDRLSVHSSISSGFSPPTLAEVRPSTNVFNEDLKAERGINYETGIRGTFSKLSFDVTGYYFKLNETIVQQRAEDGSEFFINAGQTNQLGIEATVKLHLSKYIQLGSSYTYNHYRFGEYNKDGTSYEGNRLTGVPPTVAVITADVSIPSGFYMNLTGSYTDHIPLNDANDQFAREYLLVNARVGYKITWRERYRAEVFTGIDNALDERYSLGNDLNAFGRRYYNLAPGRQFFLGAKFMTDFK